jgi:hypothetical protein
MNLMSRRYVRAGGGALGVAGTGATRLGYKHLAATGGYDAAVATTRAAVAQNPSLHYLFRFATLAPNGRKIQPLRFRVAGDRVGLPDFSRRTPVVDPDDHDIFKQTFSLYLELSRTQPAQNRAKHAEQ